VFQKSTRHLEIIDVKRVTLTKFHVKDPQILGATLHNLVASTTWHRNFLTANLKKTYTTKISYVTLKCHLLLWGKNRKKYLKKNKYDPSREGVIDKGKKRVFENFARLIILLGRNNEVRFVVGWTYTTHELGNTITSRRLH
jgi:hypothetical protein